MLVITDAQVGIGDTGRGGVGSITEVTRIHATAHMLVITDTQVATGSYSEGGLGSVTQGTRIHATTHMLVITDTQVETGRYRGGCRIFYSGYKDICYSSYANVKVSKPL